MPTLKDIAAECNVHISTVSRALHHYRDIPEDTRKRICDTAKLMGYRTNCRPVGKKKTSRIGVLLPERTGLPFFQGILAAIWECLLHRGYDLVVLHPLKAEGGTGEAPGYLAKARTMGLEGVLLLSHFDAHVLYRTDRHIAVRDLLISEIPVVAVDSCPGLCRCVLPGYREGIHALVDYIRANGHERIALVHGSSSADSGEDASAEWTNYFCEAMTDSIGNVSGNLMKCVQTGSTPAAYAATMEILHTCKRDAATCILYTDELLLKGGIEAITDSGLRLPEDISAAAIRFTDGQQNERPGVTSWCFDPGRIANTAVENILSEVNGSAQQKNRIIEVPGNLFPGKTVKRIQDPGRDSQGVHRVSPENAR